MWMKSIVSPYPSRRLMWRRADRRRWRRPPEVLDWTRSRSGRSAGPPAPSRGTSRPPLMLGQCFGSVGSSWSWGIQIWIRNSRLGMQKCCEFFLFFISLFKNCTQKLVFLSRRKSQKMFKRCVLVNWIFILVQCAILLTCVQIHTVPGQDRNL